MATLLKLYLHFEKALSPIKYNVTRKVQVFQSHVRSQTMPPPPNLQTPPTTQRLDTKNSSGDNTSLSLSQPNLKSTTLLSLMTCTGYLCAYLSEFQYSYLETRIQWKYFTEIGSAYHETPFQNQLSQCIAMSSIPMTAPRLPSKQTCDPKSWPPLS